MLNDPLFTSVALTGLTVAFLHAALPTHWLPFVLAGRRQVWSRHKTLSIAALAGTGHVLMTVMLGAAVAWFGIAVDVWTGGVFPYIAAGILIVVGFYYLSTGSHGHHHFGAHNHHHGVDGHDHPDHGDDHDHDHPHPHQASAHHNGVLLENGKVQTEEIQTDSSDKAVIIGLLAVLTFSPCEGFLPVFVAGAQFGWTGFFVLSATLAVATLAGMMLLTWLTLLGFQHAHLERFERYEGKILGALLIALGLGVLITET